MNKDFHTKISLVASAPILAMRVVIKLIAQIICAISEKESQCQCLMTVDGSPIDQAIDHPLLCKRAKNMDFRPLDKTRVYVQYGSGPSSAPARWINFDASPTLRLQKLPFVGRLFRRGAIIFPDDVRFGDITKRLPIADGTAQGVYASHVLEHLSLADFWIALHNTYRLLKPGGIFRLVIPDLEIRAQKYLERLKSGDFDANSWFMRNAHLGLECRARGLEAFARSVFGNSAHLWMWDEISMTAALKKVGFTRIRRARFNDSKDEAFRLVENADRFHDDSADLEECAMEAIKPPRDSQP